MTILAGVFSRRVGVAVPVAACDALHRGISRNPDDERIEFRLGNAYLVKIDTGAFGKPAHHRSESGAVSVLAGEPLLDGPGVEVAERNKQLRSLHAEWEQDKFALVRWSSGTFCAAFFDPARGIGHLVADRLGLRTLYYAVMGDMVYFSSALRILEGLDEVPKVLDVQAVAEITGFGYPFGAGTPYATIRMMLPCEVLTVTPAGVQSSRYFDWAAIAPCDSTHGAMLGETYRLFQRAVRQRLRGDTASFAYLSGGLDSRCVVAALRAESAQTYTFNFSLGRTQDQVFAQQYAQKCGAIHHELPTEPGPNWSAVMADAWRVSTRRQEREPEHPQLVWTGEGGSVGLGHVYITKEIVNHLRSGDLDGAIDTFLRQQNKSLLKRILRPGLARHFDGHLQSQLRIELTRLHQPDPVRALYIFLNLNGPRRHLVNHFETIDQHRLEFQLPFYDSELMEYLTSLPVDPCLYHGLYVEWLAKFDESVLAVPWQAYPGHVPSPVPIPPDLPDQWSISATQEHQSKVRKDLADRSLSMLSDPDFPRHVLDGRALGLMRLAWKLGIANYDYALKAALVYLKFTKQSKGEVRMPGPPASGLATQDQAPR